MLQASVERFGRAVAGAGPVEVGQDVAGSLGQGPAEPAQLDQGGGDAWRRQSISAVIAARAAVRSGSRYAEIIR